MMPRGIIYLFFLLISSTFTTYSQHILTGKIQDAKTKNPVSGASVFLDGTSIYTITDENGDFEFSLKDRLNTSLVISHLGYSILSIPNPFEEMPEIIWLFEKINALTPVETVAPYFTREQLLSMFRNEFLGTTIAGKSCEILNEDEIKLFYDMDNKRLAVSSEVPIIIHNAYLAYEIKYNLVDFYADYGYDTLFEETEEGIKRASFEEAKEAGIFGYFSFTDLKPRNINVKLRRQTIYKNSVPYFLKHLAEEKLHFAGYSIYTNEKWIEPKDYFQIKDIPPLKKVILLRNGDTSDTLGNDTIPFFGKMILDKGREKSEIYFFTSSFLVDAMGNTDQPHKLHFAGVLGKKRIGDLLPLDYK